MLLEFCNFKIIWSLNDLIIGRHGRDKQFYKALQLLLEFFSSNSVLYLYLFVSMYPKNHHSLVSKAAMKKGRQILRYLTKKQSYIFVGHLKIFRPFLFRDGFSITFFKSYLELLLTYKLSYIFVWNSKEIQPASLFSF